MTASSAALIPLPLLADPPTLQFPVNDAFDPDPFDVAVGENIKLKFTGTGSAVVNVYDSNSELFDLFKGSSNPYSVSNEGEGTDYQIREDLDEDTSYTISYDPGDDLGPRALPSVALRAVRGTINVKKPS